MDGASSREGRGTEGQGLKGTWSSRFGGQTIGQTREVLTDSAPSPHDVLPQQGDGAGRTLGQ